MWQNWITKALQILAHCKQKLHVDGDDGDDVTSY